MIQYSSFTLQNGLQVFVHEDHSVQSAVLNLIYNVGSRDENPTKTGFAHLFEHLMFGGSANVSNFDEPLQRVGGENNAFTSPDVTNYYVTIPASNLETAFWLESDRMLGLSFDPNVLEVQRNVVIEEFKQRYLNQPYGDVWLKLRPLAYQVHPYNWATIGKEIKHIEDATMDDVKSFFYTHYRPNNAVLVVGGNVTVDQVKHLSEKWFGPIPAGDVPAKNIPAEPIQTEPRFLAHEAAVPSNAIYKAYHVCDRLHPDYYGTDIMCDILGHGKSSRLYQKLVREQQVFSSIQAYLSGSFDPGLLVISGMLQSGISYEQAEAAIQEVVDEYLLNGPTEEELFKVKNQAESNTALAQVELLERCVSLAYAALLGQPELVNTEMEQIRAVTKEEVFSIAKKILRAENCSTLHYKAQSIES